METTVEAGDRIGKKKNLPGGERCEYCDSVLTYTGKGPSTLKEHRKFNPYVNQIKTRMSSYRL